MPGAALVAQYAPDLVLRGPWTQYCALYGARRLTTYGRWPSSARVNANDSMQLKATQQQEKLRAWRSHRRVVGTTAPFWNLPDDVLGGVLDVARLAVQAVLCVYLQLWPPRHGVVYVLVHACTDHQTDQRRSHPARFSREVTDMCRIAAAHTSDEKEKAHQQGSNGSQGH